MTDERAQDAPNRVPTGAELTALDPAPIHIPCSRACASASPSWIPHRRRAAGEQHL